MVHVKQRDKLVSKQHILQDVVKENSRQLVAIIGSMLTKSKTKLNTTSKGLGN